MKVENAPSIVEIAPDVLCHRIILSSSAKVKGRKGKKTKKFKVNTSAELFHIRI